MPPCYKSTPCQQIDVQESWISIIMMLCVICVIGIIQLIHRRNYIVKLSKEIDKSDSKQHQDEGSNNFSVYQQGSTKQKQSKSSQWSIRNKKKKKQNYSSVNTQRSNKSFSLLTERLNEEIQSQKPENQQKMRRNQY